MKGLFLCTSIFNPPNIRFLLHRDRVSFKELFMRRFVQGNIQDYFEKGILHYLGVNLFLKFVGSQRYLLLVK